MQEYVTLHDMLVQIYEVRTPEEAAALVRLGVDHIGVLIGEGAFPRELSAERATEIFAAVPAGKRCVALSLSAELDEIGRMISKPGPISSKSEPPWRSSRLPIRGRSKPSFHGC